MSKLRLLDLFSCAGGAAMGYHRAGFEVVGVDINPQPRYPFEHHVADALEFLAEHGHEFDAVHASPPCQAYTVAGHLPTNAVEHPDLLAPTRDALDALGKPYIIENVPGAPMRDFVTLCGSEFNLLAPDIDGEFVQLRRHRQFESNVWLMGAGGCQHRTGMVTASVFGHGGGMHWQRRNDPTRSKGYIPHNKVAAALLGVDWMNKREMSECIPPAYTEYLGRQLLKQLGRDLVPTSHDSEKAGTQ